MDVEVVTVDDDAAAERALAAAAAGVPVVVVGDDAAAVATLVRRLRDGGAGRVAGFVGDDVTTARTMGEELFARS